VILQFLEVYVIYYVSWDKAACLLYELIFWDALWCDDVVELNNQREEELILLLYLLGLVFVELHRWVELLHQGLAPFVLGLLLLRIEFVENVIENDGTSLLVV